MQDFGLHSKWNSCLQKRCLRKPFFSQRVPRFRFASSRSWLSPHARVLGSVRIVQRVPRFRSASSRSWLSPHARGSAPSALSNAYLDSASLHLGRGFRHMEKKKESQGKCKHFPWLSFFFSALLNALRKKPPSPQLLCLQKQRFQVRDQGFEPWTPWLRVRCSASWANRAFYVF